MHRYSSNSNTTPTSSFSMFISRPDHQPFEDYDSYPSTIMSSPVDCTLSLGTPSTRQKKENRHQRSSSSSSNLSWDMFHTKKPSKSNGGSSRGNNTSSSTSSNTSVLNNMSGGDPLLARRCANCDTTSTPLWRNGPRGPKSLCNACGIRYKKEERRAAATNNGATAAAVMEQQHYLNHHHQHTWGHHQGNEFRFIDDDNDRDSPFLSWRLNVPDRSSLVHDYT